MATKRELLGSELMKEIFRIRIDTLWYMLALKAHGRLPPVEAEKATGDFDDKGALFMPGGFVFQDWEGNPVRKERFRDKSAEGFRKMIREAMRFDGVQLLYPDGIARSVKLGNTSFAKIAASILENRKEALRRRVGLGEKPPERITSADISRSYCPNYYPPPYGSRTSLSSDISVCLTEPRMYFRQVEDYFNLRGAEAENFWLGIRVARQQVIGKDDAWLAQPYVVTCHSTRYREEILTGITRISGFGKFGEFATVTLEAATNELLHEVEGGRTQYSPEEIIATYRGLQVVGVLRIYPRTNPGARLMKGVTTLLIQPEKELGLDLRALTVAAKKHYKVR